MERKRQKLMQLQLKRQSELEAARMSKEQENAEKNELTRQRLEEANRKKEEQRLRQQAVFEQYQKRKLEAEKEDNPVARQGTVLREPKARRARPLSVHANTIHHQVSVPTSHEPTAMKRVSSQGDILKLGQGKPAKSCGTSVNDFTLILFPSGAPSQPITMKLCATRENDLVEIL